MAEVPATPPVTQRAAEDPFDESLLKIMDKKRTIWIGGQTEPFESMWKKRGILGEPGTYGTTYLCTDSSGRRAAVKELPKDRFHRIPNAARKILFRSMQTEIRVLQVLSKIDSGYESHPNIVQLYGVYEDKKFLRLVMEECSGGSLFQQIIKRGRYNEQDAAMVAKQIIAGLLFMHETHEVVHNDLKPENILFDKKGSEGIVKIIDFGMSRVLPRLQHLTQLCGTPYYTAPEIIVPSKDLRHYNHMADMWSMGVILFVMIFGYPPFYVDPSKYPGKLGQQAIYRRIRKGFIPKVRSTERHGYGPWFPDHIPSSREVRDLIGHLLESDVAERYSAKEAYGHPWINTGGVPASSDSSGGSSATSPEAAADDAPDTSRKVLITSIAKFTKGCQFKQVVIKLFAKEFEVMRPHHFAELEKLFQELDADGDGIISYGDFETALERLDGLSLTKRQIADIFAELDLREMDGLKFEDLLGAVVHDYLVACDERLYRAFAELDEDEDGFITLEELKMKMKDVDPLGEWDRAMEIIAEQSLVDDSGKICYEEFLLALHPNFEETPEWVPVLYKMDTIVHQRERKKAQQAKSKKKGAPASPLP